MISANGGLPAHRYTIQVTPRWPRGSEPASSLEAVFARTLALRFAHEPGLLCWSASVHKVLLRSMHPSALVLQSSLSAVAQRWYFRSLSAL